MISFDAAHAAVYYPADRRFRIWIHPSFLIVFAVLVLLPVLAAWVEFLIIGLPYISPVPQVYPNAFVDPHGFPFWVRYCHFFNFVFLMMLIRSGISILYDHTRLYFNNDCTPGTEWIRLTPIIVPTDRVWTAKDDARYITPMVGTPGYSQPKDLIIIEVAVVLLTAQALIINRLAGMPYPLWRPHSSTTHRT
jgi:hypothetical protein